MVSPIEWRNEKAVFLSFYPHFFSVTMMLQVPWGTSSPTGEPSEGTVNKEIFSCTPVVPLDSLGGQTKTNINVGSLLQE